MATTPHRRPPDRPEDCATAWFAALERARLTGDRQLEARARQELERLGVAVAFAPRPDRQEARRG